MDLDASRVTDETPGRYRQIREYARGGMGRVLLVHDMDMGRDVALKELFHAGSSGETTLSPEYTPLDIGARYARFLREARITCQLEHPSIVPVYELGRREDGRPYYTMKLVPGRTIRQAIEQAGSLRSRLGLLSHFLDLCQAIAFAHSKGVIHRDIKPSNVMIGQFGETIVIDWGLAKPRGDAQPPVAAEEAADNGVSDSDEAGLTKTGQYLGTPQYMSPEQALGDLGNVGEASDVYSLGVVLYEILTGRPPFQGGSASQVMNRVLTQEPPSVESIEPEAPVELAAICVRAMRKDPRGRYSSAKELAEEIQRFQTGALVGAYQYKTGDLVRRFVRRHAKAISGAAAAFLAILVTGALGVAGMVREQAQTERALYQSSINLAYNAVDNGRLEEAEDALARAPETYRGLEWGLVGGMCHPERMILRHRDYVEIALYSPDGTKIVTCVHNGNALIWDAPTGQKSYEICPPDESFCRAVWSADGTLLVLTTWLERTYIYDTRDYALLREVRGYAPAMSPDSKILAAATQDGEVVTLYDPLSGNVMRTFPKLPTHIIQLAFSDNGRQVAAGINDGSVWVWTLDTDAAWHTGPVHAPSTRYVVFSPDSAVLLSAGADGKGILWDAGSGAELRRLEGHEAAISGACFLPGGRRILTASADRTIRVWDAETGKEVAKHDGFSSPLGFVAPSPDGSEFMTHIDSSTERMAAVIRPVIPLKQRQTLAAHNAPVNTVAFSPDGALLASGGGSWRNLDDDRVILWDTRDNSIRREIRTGHGPVLGVAFFSDGTRIAAGNEDGTASIFDVATGQCLRTFSKHSKACGSVAVSPDGSVLATASWQNDAILWDAATGERRALLNDSPDRLDAIAFDPVGRLVATGGMDGPVRLYRVSDGQLDGELLPEDLRQAGELAPKGNRRIGALAFSPDGKWLVAAGDLGRVTMWDVAQRREVRTFKGHKSYVKAAVFSHDGRRLITAGKDAAIWFWDVETGQQVMFLERHKQDVNALALRGDDGQMASASNDGTVVLWPILPWRASE